MIKCLNFFIFFFWVVFLPACERVVVTQVNIEERNTVWGYLEPLTRSPIDRDLLVLSYRDILLGKDYPFENVGAVLEGLAVEGIKRQFPAPKYEVTSGIAYYSDNGETIGELDLVVFHRDTGYAILVGEVKLSSNHEAAVRKANSQIKRFRKSIANGSVARLVDVGKSKREYQTEQFENVLYFGKVGSKGSMKFGFDAEIDLTREEGNILQQLLLNK